MKLGKLETVSIRKVWPKEDRDFTPWIQENIDVISDVIGVGITDVEREINVGKYSADLVGVMEGTDKPVVIENQFGQTDHDHLGKLLTYISGKNAKVGVWIAERFRAEHLATLEYLNENTAEGGISFFGVEVSAKRIGDSAPAPEFNVVVKPNEWKKQVSQNALSESEIARRKFRLDFFGRLADEYKKANPSWHKVKAQPNHWLSFYGTGVRGCALGWVFRSTGGHRFAIELYIDRGNKEENDYIFNKLLDKKEQIEKELGFKLDFQKLEEKRACRIEFSKPISTVSTQLSEKEQEKLIRWGAEEMKGFSSVMTKYLKQIRGL